ncbi:hypothetical protein [Prevotella sp. 10(H)]|uniref:hypothetical protein n=1 Tax=Prevotella sp. 10(H) TaxID=1158294 RepID=UPI0004A724E8|nr:hypothetical protein [Prevotella sp. 10(H)]
MKKTLLIVLSCMWTCLYLSAQATDNNVVVKEDSLISLQSATVLKNDIFDPPKPLVLPPSPQAKQFMRYGEVPVDLSSGVPEISIPIYTINVNNLQVPISISYHAGGNKVSDIASVVGLGWTLNAGGMITQTVNGMPDDEGSYIFLSAREANDQFLIDKQSVLSVANKPVTPTWYFRLKGCPFHNCTKTVSDRFFYSFNGNIGVFREDITTRELKTIPYSPLKINRIKDSKGFVTDIEVIDTEGRSWIFKRFSVMQNMNYSFASGYEYHLSKIKFPDSKEEINFTYNYGQKYLTTEVSRNINWMLLPTRSFSDRYGPPGLPAYDILKVDSKGETVSNIQKETLVCTPVLLSMIEWSGGKVEFSYKSDRKDIMKERLEKITIRNSTLDIRSITLSNKDNYLGSKIEDWRMLLDAIDVHGEKYNFQYNKSLKLPPFDDTKCSEDFWGYYNGANSENWTPYKFKYINSSSNDIEYNSVRESNPSYTQAGILTKITYPTGGHTFFTYEQNEGKNIIQDKPSVKYFGGLRIKEIVNYDGENIISKKTYEYEGGPVIQIQRWNYYDEKTYMEYAIVPDERASYFCRGDIWNNLISSCLAYSQISKTIYSKPIYPIQNPWGTSVFYNKVTEKNSTEGKTEYYFQLSKGDSRSASEWGHRKPLLKEERVYQLKNNEYKQKRWTKNEFKNISMASYTTGVKLEDNNRIFLYDPTITNNYMRVGDIFMHTQEFYYDAFGFTDVYAYRDIDILESKEVREYENKDSIITTTNYSYDPNYKILTPIEEKVKDSTGNLYTTSITYPFNYSGTLYNKMITKNMLSVPVEKILKHDSKEIKRSKINYTEMSEMIVPGSFLTSSGGGLLTTITYDQYDKKGNILQYTTLDGISTVCIWGYNYQYLIAEIKNIKYSEIEKLLNIEAISSSKEPDMQAVNALRTKLPASFVTTYTYNPLVGIISMTDPRGYTVKYEYDELGHLKYKKDDQGNLIEEYKYNYRIK